MSYQFLHGIFERISFCFCHGIKRQCGLAILLQKSKGPIEKVSCSYKTTIKLQDSYNSQTQMKYKGLYIYTSLQNHLSLHISL